MVSCKTCKYFGYEEEIKGVRLHWCRYWDSHCQPYIDYINCSKYKEKR